MAKSYKDALRALKLAAAGIAGGCLLAYVAAWGKTAWRQRDLRSAFEAQKDQAAQLGLAYEAVLLAPRQLANKPVLWRLGRTGGDWYYQADRSRPVRFLNPPDLPMERTKGMDTWDILALVRGAGPQGVFLEYLRTY